MKGWVRNRRDGSVEAVIHGPKEDVDAVIEWAHHGPDMARVDNVVVSDATGEYSEFSIQESL